MTSPTDPVPSGSGAARDERSPQTEPDPDENLDYRFTLANERTYLAWIRTALGLLAGGVAVRQLVAPLGVSGARTIIGVGCVVLAVLIASGAYFHWRTVQRAMVAGDRLPHSVLVPLLSASVAVIAIFALIAVVL